MSETDKIDTRELGLATEFNTRRKFFAHIPADMIEVRFDTGIIMYVPNSGLFAGMIFHLEEKDPDPPN